MIYDWAGNGVCNKVFDYFDDASDELDRMIDRCYGELSDDEYDTQRGEYQIIEVTSDEDNL